MPHFLYGDNSVIYKYLRDIPLKESCKQKFSQDIATLLNAIVAHQKNPGYFARIFLRLSQHYSHEIIISCIMAIKNYVTSRNFNFPGKYQQRSWFWGEIKYISEDKNNSISLAINHCLDKLAAEYKSKLDKSDQHHIISIHAQSHITAFKRLSLIRFGVALLSFSPSLTLAQEHPVEHDTRIVTASFIESQLHQHYYIIHNAPLSDIRYYIFLEAHPNQTHHLLKRDIIPLIANPGDLFLFEGVESLEYFDCELLCITPEQVQLISKDCELNMGFGAYTCIGSDNMELASKGRDEAKIANALQPLPNQLKDLSDKYYQISQETIDSLLPLVTYMYKSLNSINNSLKEIEAKVVDVEDIKETIKLFKKCHSNSEKMNLAHTFMFRFKHWFDTTYQTIKDLYLQFSVINSGTKLILERNKAIMKTLNDAYIEGYRGNKFLFWGANHFIPFHRIKNTAQITELEESDPQYEVRKYFRDKPTAIFYPK